MKNKLARVKFFYFINLILVVITVAILIKFIVDFCQLNIETSFNNNDTYIINDDRFIVKPRIQLEDGEKFEYIESENGFLQEDGYLFNNINMNGYFGNVKAGKLEIKDNKNIFEFTIQPNFTIYLNNIEK